MNEELIKQLMEERSALYPYGLPIQPRGCSKTYLYLSHFLRWHAYDLCCQMLECAVLPMNIDYAHKWINEFVAEQMPE